MNCPYCGNAVPDGAAFCGNCGAKLEAAAAPVGLPPQPSAEIDQEPMAPPAPISGPDPVMEPMAPPPGFTPTYAPPPAPFPGPVMEPMAPPPAFTPSYSPPPAPAKKSNTTLIIIIVVVLLLLCCCCALFFVSGPILATFNEIVAQYSMPTPGLR